MDNEKMKLPTENVELPSKGLLYPLENPLSSGTVEMKYIQLKKKIFFQIKTIFVRE